ncbi:hypothetical protein [Natronoglomus mannanivorans]|uniref:Type I restriction enzyme R protein N terminus (HSDR_N) n=1 Tax=Natronoglomus mannanivorans TaxID=2979990 RepID=A0AAP2YV74_9EURY|nr:hypothetical protein [Halobacteria archaeon AArc-xg1-1]
MDRGGLRSFVVRTQALVDPSPPATLEETRTWIVEPLLETLGWDVRSDANACEIETDRTLEFEGVTLEYVLSVDATPGIFVAVDSFTDDLSDRREHELRRAMQASGVDRSIYTNGRELVLLAGPSGQDRFQCPLASLHDAESELEHVSFRRTERRLERHSRAFAARRLAVDRAAVADSIVDDLAALAGESYRAELQTATERFVDDLIRGFATDSGVSGPSSLERRSDRDSDRDPDDHDSVILERDPSDVPSSDRTGDGDSRVGFGEEDQEPDTTLDSVASEDGSPSSSPSTDTPSDDSSTTEDGDSDGGSNSTEDGLSNDSRPDTDTDTTGTDHTTNTTDTTGTTGTDDSEYVVRFFNDRGSVGAIGHSQPDQAMVHAAEYLLDLGLTGLELPWGPEDDVTVLNDEPTLEDGSPMVAAEGLSNGSVLNTGGSLEKQARRVGALAEQAGLRAMLTGDWPEQE